MHIAPFRINFSEPTILDLNRTEWPNYLDVITADEVGEDQWIWLLITAPDDVPSDGSRLFVPAAHPMHLHGHDFALLKQSSTNWEIDKKTTELNCRGEGIKCDNPPRRDVALLPASGYLIIAFKADNPGKHSFPTQPTYPLT
jgi:Multicopper oxidase